MHISSCFISCESYLFSHCSRILVKIRLFHEFDLPPFRRFAMILPRSSRPLRASVYPVRPQEAARDYRGLARPGGPPGWLEESDPAGCDFESDGRFVLPALAVLYRLPWLWADGISNCCYKVNVHNHPSWLKSWMAGMDRLSNLHVNSSLVRPPPLAPTPFPVYWCMARLWSNLWAVWTE
jgi:hypothetical protein